MGRRGPKPTPTGTLKRRGSWLAPQRTPAEGNESSPVGGESSPNEASAISRAQHLCAAPDWLSDAARAVFTQLTTLLARQLHPGDAFALARYASQLVEWRCLWEDLQQHGLTERDEKTGRAMRRPETILLRELSQTLLGLEKAFGLTPAARDRLSVPEPEVPHADPGEQFFHPYGE